MPNNLLSSFNFLYLKYFFIACTFLFLNKDVCSQEPPPPPTQKEESETLTNKPIVVPEKVTVNPATHDADISKRLEDILKATGWFVTPKVKVQNGVVFLEGKTKTEQLKKWAEELARKTQDTAAVVNRIEIISPSVWDFTPVLYGLKEQWITLLRTIPTVLFGLFILTLTWLMSRLITFIIQSLLKDRMINPLIQRVIAWSIGLIVFLIGLMVVFNLMGLSTVAFTVIGGTGLIGIILGIAFREITENFLASIFLSYNNPFKTGDLIEIEGIMGYVERLTFRSTNIITLEGTYVQIPNATVYRSKISNFTSNTQHREEFAIAISYESSISNAQEIALKVLDEHPAVLKKPEPLVLVDNLGEKSVNLKIYFWINRNLHSWLKVKSSVIRLIKREFQKNNVLMPVGKLELGHDKRKKAIELHIPKDKEIIATPSEDKLDSEDETIKSQANQTITAEAGPNLLKKNPEGLSGESENKQEK